MHISGSNSEIGMPCLIPYILYPPSPFSHAATLYTEHNLNIQVLKY